ncbi:MAG: hypothetical protein UIH99_04000 [Alphaproteobacteria bacterium]|nr:hypothetical protein [Alphaproteobacteria bacterium]
MKNQKQYRCVYTRSQKIKGWLAFIMLFVCGIMVGVSLHGYKNELQQSVSREYAEFSKSDCNDLKRKMIQDPAASDRPQVYEKYCEGRVEKKEKPKQEPKVEKNKEPQTACQVIEEIQLRWLNDEKSGDVILHEENVRIYEVLFQHGCPENQEKYRDAIAREMDIVAALKGKQSPQSTCQQIEESLLHRLPGGYSDSSAEERIERAKIYANLSERGCPENSQKYVDLAKAELDIARALEDDKFDNEETIEVVETYKRLDMQAAAEEIFETAKKLTNPAIDFILEVEKIINEK